MLIEPRQRLLLNLPIITVRLVRGIVAEISWAAGPVVVSSGLPCGLALAGRWKEDVLLAADYHACLWRRHGHQVRNVETAENAIAKGHADLISFGRPFISNPDLVERFRNGWPLAEPAPISDWSSPSAGKGYTDFPAFALSPTPS